MKPCLKVLLLVLITASANAQRHLPDSITKALKNASDDSSRYQANSNAYFYFDETNRDSALYYVNRLYLLAKKDNKQLLIARALAFKGYQLTGASRYPEALKALLQGYAIVSDPKSASNSWFLNPQSTPEKTRLLMLSLTHHMFAILMDRTENTGEMIFHFKEAKKIALQINNRQRIMLADMNLGSAYADVNRLDSALMYETEARDIALKTGQKKYLGYILGAFGNIALKQGDKVKAKQFYYAGVLLAVEQNNTANEIWNYCSLANLYISEKQKDSSLYFSFKLLAALKALGSTASQRVNIGIAYQNLYRSYELRKQPDSAFKYAQIALLKTDSLYKKRIADLAQFQNISFQEQLRLQALEKEKNLYQSKLRTYGLLMGLGVVLTIALILYRNSLQRKKAYLLLQKQNGEIEAQNARAQVEIALERVRSKTMAMRSSQDVAETVAAMFGELVKLGIEKNVRCGIGIIDNVARIELWTAFTNPDGQASLITGSLDLTIHPMVQSLYNAWKNKEECFFYEMTGDDLIAYYQALNDAPDYPTRFDLASLPARQFQYDFFFPEGTIFAFSPEPLTPEALQIFKRFAGVFGLTYRRYLDLQKAEAQARESQIQLGLERVRARAMAMQSSGELAEVVDIVFKELTRLDFGLTHCAIAIADAGSVGLTLWQANSEADQPPVSFYRKSFDHPYPNAAYKEWKKRTPKWVYHLKGAEKKAMHDYYASSQETMCVPNAVKEGMAAFDGIILSHSFNNFGYLRTDTTDPLSEDNLDIVYRFAKAFDLCYTRFTDIKQAEAQAKESQIQLALERVRARTMAMQKSEELAETATVLFQQLLNLGISSERTFIGMPNDDTRKIELWGTAQGGYQMSTRFEYEADATYAFREIYKAWEEKRSELTVILKGKSLEEHVNYVRNVLHMPLLVELVQKQRILYNAFFSKGLLMIVTPDKQSKETVEILERFAGVFDGTYTRFLDLQKAEAQAREAQIEAALERVRSKTMAMHNSGDVADTAAVMFDELIKLGVERAVRCGIGILTRGSSEIEVWTARAGENEKPELIIGHFDTNIHPLLKGLYDAWHKHEQSFSYVLADDDRVKYYESINSQPGYPIKYDISELPSPQYNSDFFFTEGVLYAFTSQPLSDEISSVFKRFAGVFGQTYRRYLDLQKAEEQAREAQIEAALERVRSRTMAMQKSDELKQAIQLIYEQLIQLNFNIDVANFAVDHTESDDFNLWLAVSGQQYPAKIYTPYFDHPIFRQFVEAKEKGKDFYAFECTLEEKNEFFNHFFKYAPQVSKEKEEAVYSSPGYAQSTVFMKTISLAIINYTGLPYSEAENMVFRRFGKVFEQTYTRFNDLKQAEAQAREAKIEAALEKVRGKAMAMYNSNDLSSTASMVFTELRKLGLNSKRCGVALLSKNSRTAQSYVATSSGDNDSLDLLGTIELAGHPSLEKQYRSWLKNENYFDVLKGDDLKSYKEVIYKEVVYSMLPVPDDQSDQEEYGYFLPFSEGFLFSWTAKPFSEKEINILTRFKNIIDLTFRRYLELQKSEASARAAVREASLDRVRAEIASMRKRSDLERITPLIWEELTVLGIPFIRCGVFIMDEKQKLIHTFLSTPDGKAIGAFHVPFDTSGNFEKMVDSWRHGVPYIDHWEEEAFSQFADTLLKQGAIASKAQYMRTLPHEGIHLNFLPFLQGMLYVGNTMPLSNDEIELVQSLADAFSTAYARYEDFNKLEAAKKVVEETLTDLKAAQTQLIQSEKMASLGELTAGIAHEIQNPLNFVNNFSEVNSELIEEMEDEIDKGNFSEVKAIAADLKQNEQKINMHGKRADSIVKSMLEHSRISSGEKQLTNINALADEFIKLSYHGLRAKDKSFNAEMISDFDPNLPKMNMVQQDIGRVLLNLFNNAFYAVNQKKKALNGEYKPEVTVTTLAENGHVTIKVKDNGSGIPDPIKDKIMQPFFTTKPTGEGTGLGLSLSYDIVVKGHGGKIEVNTKEGEFTEFIVSLPLNEN